MGSPGAVPAIRAGPDPLRAEMHARSILLLGSAAMDGRCRIELVGDLPIERRVQTVQERLAILSTELARELCGILESDV